MSCVCIVCEWAGGGRASEGNVCVRACACVHACVSRVCIMLVLV